MAADRAARILLVLVVSVSLAAVLTPAVAQTEDDVDRAKGETERRERELEDALADLEMAGDEVDAAVRRYEEINAELQDVVFRLALLADRVSDYERELRLLRDEIRDLAVEAYMSGGTEPLFFEASTFSELVTGQEVLEQATERSMTRFDRLEATRRELDRVRTDYDAEEDRADELRAEAEGAVAALAVVLDEQEASAAEASGLLATAEDEYRAAVQRLEAERLRQRLAAAAARQGAAAGIGEVSGAVCPVAGPVGFIDSWGFPRSGGRGHVGTDMFAKRNTPLVAVDAGTIQLGSNNLGGLTVWLTADHGIAYYYAHLEAYGPSLVSGQRVSKGQTIGLLGNSGNARFTSPHLHIQMHPGGRGSRPVNPYPSMVYACS